MKQNKILYTGLIVLMVLLSFSSLGAGISDDQTELEIVSMKAGFGAIIIEIENIGSETASNIASSIQISGGLFNRIDLMHVCDGCSVCGSTLAPGAVKTESSREAGFLFGFGPITIKCTASAKNADLISMTKQATLIGPILILN